MKRRLWAVWWAWTRRYRMLLWWLKGKPIPKVCDLVEYGLDSWGTASGHYRVSSYLRVAVKPKKFHGVFDEILFDACQTLDGERWQWCLPHEATHLSLIGGSYARAPIGECKVTGSLKGVWADDHIASDEQYALMLGAAHEMIF